MIKSIKKFRKILNARQKRNVIILIFMMILAAFLEVLGVGMMLPLMTALMDDNLLQENALAANVAGFLGIHSTKTFVLVCILVIIAIYIVKDLYIIFETYIMNRFIHNARFTTQSRILKNYMNRPYEFFLSASSGETIQVVQRDVENAFMLLMNILNFFSETIVAVALVCAVAVINLFMTLIVAGVMLITVILIAKIVRPKMTRAGVEFVGNMTTANKWLLQMVSGIKEIKISRSQGYFQSCFDESARKSVCAAQNKAIWDNVPRLLIEMTAMSSALAAVAIQVQQGVRLASLISGLSAFVMAAVRLLPAANRAVNAISGMAYYEPSLDNVLKMMQTLEEQNATASEGIEEKNTSAEISCNDRIELKNVTYSYPGGEKNILSGANMTIPIGASVGIVGASGAGKTTSVDILLGLLHPQDGEILSDGVDIRSNYSGWLSHIGYIPQSIFMLDGTIRENLLFGKRKDASGGTSGSGTGTDRLLAGSGTDSDARLWEVLKEARLDDFVRSLPEGLDTEIGERGVRLSGGQRQRIGIARALYSDPEILVFDEATSSLDNETEAAIMESINSLHGRKTMIIIAHRLTTIADCDIIYRVEEGKIEAIDKKEVFAVNQ